MFFIKVEDNRGEAFGVLVWKLIPSSGGTEDDGDCVLAVSRQIGHPAEFEDRQTAEQELKSWLRYYPAAADSFSFNVEEVN